VKAFMVALVLRNKVSGIRYAGSWFAVAQNGGDAVRLVTDFHDFSGVDVLSSTVEAWKGEGVFAASPLRRVEEAPAEASP
jgi:hypothetical protein